MPLPALRFLDMSPVEHEGETLICLRDPEGFVDEQVVLSPVAFFVASHLDGVNDITDIQYIFHSHTGGRMLDSEDIQTVVQYLDERGFLLSPKFVEIHRRVREDFSSTDTRRSYLAGKSYPETAQELGEYLGEMFLREKGPGKQPDLAENIGDPICAMVVPHIDFDRGGHSYAHGYLRIAQCRRPQTVFLFGVAHAAPPVPFTLTRKHFETPFGTLWTNRDLVERLGSACSWDAFEYELVHRTEHSIEFQAVMLGHLFGSSVRIVPILCGAFVPEGKSEHPSGSKDIARFLDACRDIVAEGDGGVCVIAAADLAHVGKRFGDPFDIDDAVIGQIEARDREDLSFVTALDADGWYRSVMKDDNERRVCGLNCIYATLRSVEGSARTGELLNYDHAMDPAGGVVSFAGVVFPAASGFNSRG